MASENLGPQIISRILGEIRDLVQNPPDGIVYVDNEDSSVSEIYATITGPEDTPFASGKFLMKLVLSEDYPSSPPKGFFLTRIYHPNVSSTGDICVNTLKRDWNVDVTLRHVLQVVRCLLIVPFPESSLNDEAGKLFMDSYEEYARRAKLMTEVHALPVSTDESGDGSGSGSGVGKSVSGESSSADVAKAAAGQRVKEAKRKGLKRL
eukprot:gene9034-18713_t